MSKNKILIVSFLIVISVSSISFAIDTNSVKYLPMRVGNYWVYNSGVYGMGFSHYWVDVCRITDSSAFNNHLYYHFICSNTDLPNGYYRIDSTTGSLYKYDSVNSCQYYNFEKLVDSLSAVNGDSIKNCAYYIYKCIGTSAVYVFNDSTSRISFYMYHQGSNSGFDDTRRFLKKYGLYSVGGGAWGGGGFGGGGSTLKGCRVNGNVFGDTSLISVRCIGSFIPSSYCLYQNYPNPFNPLTNIKFEIPKSSFVNIKVFDISGKEIENLVNENLQAGTYETQWNASKYSSGIYFYHLSINNQRLAVRKMVLVK
jgi:hypothetical protein